MTLKSEVAELHYEVAELSSGELPLTFTTGKNSSSIKAKAKTKANMLKVDGVKWQI